MLNFKKGEHLKVLSGYADTLNSTNSCLTILVINLNYDNVRHAEWFVPGMEIGGSVGR